VLCVSVERIKLLARKNSGGKVLKQIHPDLVFEWAMVILNRFDVISAPISLFLKNCRLLEQLRE
jgi:hypothetical protein